MSKTLEEVRRWKEEVRQEIDGVIRRERLAYFRQASAGLEEKTGVTVDLRRATRRG